MSVILLKWQHNGNWNITLKQVNIGEFNRAFLFNFVLLLDAIILFNKQEHDISNEAIALAWMTLVGP